MVYIVNFLVVNVSNEVGRNHVTEVEILLLSLQFPWILYKGNKISIFYPYRIKLC